MNLSARVTRQESHQKKWVKWVAVGLAVSRMLLQPANDLLGTLIRRKHRVEDGLNHAAPDDERQALHQPHARHLEGGQP